MLYENEYRNTRNKTVFTNLMKRKYSHLKDNTIERRYYNCKKELGKQIQYRYSEEEKIKPSILKMIMFKDMKKFNNNITRKSLNKYGFLDSEINWLEDEVLIEVET